MKFKNSAYTNFIEKQLLFCHKHHSQKDTIQSFNRVVHKFSNLEENNYWDDDSIRLKILNDGININNTIYACLNHILYECDADYDSDGKCPYIIVNSYNLMKLFNDLILYHNYLLLLESFDRSNRIYFETTNLDKVIATYGILVSLYNNYIFGLNLTGTSIDTKWILKEIGLHHVSLSNIRKFAITFLSNKDSKCLSVKSRKILYAIAHHINLGKIGSNSKLMSNNSKNINISYINKHARKLVKDSQSLWHETKIMKLLQANHAYSGEFLVGYIVTLINKATDINQLHRCGLVLARVQHPFGLYYYDKHNVRKTHELHAVDLRYLVNKSNINNADNIKNSLEFLSNLQANVRHFNVSALNSKINKRRDLLESKLNKY